MPPLGDAGVTDSLAWALFVPLRHSNALPFADDNAAVGRGSAGGAGDACLSRCYRLT